MRHDLIMARQLLEPNVENATISKLKEIAREGTSETALRSTAIQFLLAGTTQHQVCHALEVTDRALRKWINAFNHCSIDGLIAKKRPRRTRILAGQKDQELVQIIEEPQRAERTFWIAKAFHGYLSETYELECSYRTVVRFFHKEGFALRVPAAMAGPPRRAATRNIPPEAPQPASG